MHRRRQRAMGLEPGWLDVGDLRRTFMLARAPAPEAPLLVALHGLGTTGRNMAALTGLAARGPAAGFVTVFPDGWGKVWNDGLRRTRPDSGDAAFLAKLVRRLVLDGTAREGCLFLVGLSNGAFFAEHVARHALLPLTGLVLVAGSATEPSRERSPHSAQATAFLSFAGTADPLIPYGGGLVRSRTLLTRLGDRRRGEPRRPLVAVERVAADWAAANGCAAVPSTDRLPSLGRNLPVTRLTWSAPGRSPAVLYRVEGGGHTWPGGPQYLPARLVGPVAKHLDATGILLETARDQLVRS